MLNGLLLILVCLGCCILAGCQSNKQDTETDRLWRSGYGFRNPDRPRKGQAPLNLDGSEYQ